MMSPLALSWNLGRIFRKQSIPIQAEVSRRIFLIGHNKCGTRSINKLLKKNGYSSIHYDKGRLAKRIQANFIFSRPLLGGVDLYCGYTDMELCWEFYAYRFFPFFGSSISGFFIYSMCDVNRLVDSCMDHRKGAYYCTYLNKCSGLLRI